MFPEYANKCERAPTPRGGERAPTLRGGSERQRRGGGASAAVLQQHGSALSVASLDYNDDADIN
eukprot:166776-Chlamydomonas_euryale.AAC.2